MTTILITGAGRGIGRQLAVQAVSRGWKVLASARRPEDLPDGVEPLQFDVTDNTAIRAEADRVDVPIDILINNAGIIGPAQQSVSIMDFEGALRTLDVNVLGPLRVTQAFLGHLGRGRRPRVLTISSRMGSLSMASSDRIAYRASKAAINRVVRGMSTDLAAQGIAVASIHPGWVKTDMGGKGADIEPATSASGILDIADGLTLSGTGRFLNWDGSELPW